MYNPCPLFLRKIYEVFPILLVFPRPCCDLFFSSPLQLCPHILHYGRVDSATNSLKFPLSRPCNVGEECYLSYGKFSSSHLVTFYGFLPQGENPYDVISLGNFGATLHCLHAHFCDREAMDNLDFRLYNMCNIHRHIQVK